MPAAASPLRLFAISYIAIWTLVGLAVYVLYQPHGTAVAGVLTVAAGLYELTPLKQACRRRCRANNSGFAFGLNCVGSSAGMMVLFLAVGVMNIAWMCVVALLVLAQKLLPPRMVVDVPIALAIVGLGVAIAVAPSAIPGLNACDVEDARDLIRPSGHVIGARERLAVLTTNLDARTNGAHR